MAMMESDMDSYLNPIDVEDNSRDIWVTVTLTLSKSFKINVKGYEVYRDESEDGVKTAYDYSNCNLNDFIDRQITMPQDLAKFTETMFKEDLDLKAAGMPLYLSKAIDDCSNWYIDDIKVEPEE